MTFKGLACDYDGTLASHDRIGEAALAALARAREADLRLVLVTGRSFFDLTRICERLDLFDAVVAENGAVLYFPAAGMIRDQGPPPPPRLLAELDRRGIFYHAGRVIVGTGRQDEPAVREALAATDVNLDLVYNRGSMMLLPAGISKGSSLRQVIGVLGLSFHDVLAVGDAENDLDLFEASGWAACPANAVPELARRADWVFPGDDGEAVARAIAGPVLDGSLRLDQSPRQRIPLGWAVETAEPVTVPARGVNLLIHGDPLSGKSWLAGALAERLVAQRYAVCVIDPEGDYRVLGRLPGVTWEEIDDRPSMTRALAHLERDPAACVIADLSAVAHPLKVRLVEDALAQLDRLRQRHGRPHWVVLDEAHYSLHREGVAAPAAGLEAKGFCLVTYRPSWLRDSVVKAIDVFVLARTTLPEELAFLGAELRARRADGERTVPVLSDLPDREFVIVQPSGAATSFTAPPRATAHVRHLTKYADSRVPPHRAFDFRDARGEVVASAASLTEFRDALVAVDDAVLAEHAARGDFSRWLRDVFSDRELAGQVRKTEARFGRGEIRGLREAIERLIAGRYHG
jgi:hydroxymethylpyrimidine pyrophosphatase-like HAD family hydrolase